MRALMFAFAALTFAGPAAACVVGDALATPMIRITCAPPRCCVGVVGFMPGKITGRVQNVDTASTVVVLYAKTDQYYVQPFTASPRTEISCDGTFRNNTHSGDRFCAVLARRSWSPPSSTPSLPSVGGDVLAVACWPDSVPPIEWKGIEWILKLADQDTVGPGPNYFAASCENIWLDGSDRLHLRLTQRRDRWYCAEIFSAQPLGHGLYQFEVQSPVDQMDPTVVFAGFVYESDSSEVDFEFSKALATPRNAQYVVQPYATPGNLLRYDWVISGVKSTYELYWTPDRVVFLSRLGGIDDRGPVLESWEYTGPDIPAPDVERWHFNLWLYKRIAPASGNEIEVIVSDFRHRAGVTAVPERAGDFRYHLFQNFPNPFNPRTIINYSIEERTHVTLRIYDVKGRLIKTLVDGTQDPNPLGYAVAWDGRNEAGEAVSSGIYFYRLRAVNFAQTRRMVLLK